MGRSNWSHDRWSTSRWVTTTAGIFLSMASTASALSLSSFQVITSSAVPISCILAYNSQIEGCRTKDFTSGNVCSASCVAGLSKIQVTLEDVCSGVRVKSNTVLAQALEGNLVSLLCPGNSTPGTTTTSSTPPNTSSRPPATTTTSTAPRSSTIPTRVPSLTFTTVRPPTSATSTQTQTQEAEETEASSSTTTEEAEFSSTPFPTFVQSEPPVSTDVATATSDTNSPAATGGSDGDDTAAGPPGSGGGSPFDAFRETSSQPRQFVSRGLEAGLVVLGLSLLLLR